MLPWTLALVLAGPDPRAYEGARDVGVPPPGPPPPAIDDTRPVIRPRSFLGTDQIWHMHEHDIPSGQGALALGGILGGAALVGGVVGLMYNIRGVDSFEGDYRGIIATWVAPFVTVASLPFLGWGMRQLQLHQAHEESVRHKRLPTRSIPGVLAGGLITTGLGTLGLIGSYMLMGSPESSFVYLGSAISLSSGAILLGMDAGMQRGYREHLQYARPPASVAVTPTRGGGMVGVRGVF